MTGLLPTIALLDSARPVPVNMACLRELGTKNPGADNEFLVLRVVIGLVDRVSVPRPAPGLVPGNVLGQ